MLTKDDLMKLSKERLAELLLEEWSKKENTLATFDFKNYMQDDKMKCIDCYNEGCLQRAYTADAECVFEQWETQEFDCQSFRNQAAKDILCAMIASPSIIKLKDDKGNLIEFCKEDACKVSIEYADELFKQLKEKEEK